MSRIFLCFALLMAIACEQDADPKEETERPTVPGPLDALSRRFGRLRARLESQHGAAVLSLDRLFVLESRAVAVPFDLAPGVCTTFVALAGGGVRDLALTLYDGDGRKAAVDGAEAEAGLVYVCPQSANKVAAMPHYLVVEAHAGGGAVVLGAFRSNGPGDALSFEGLFEGLVAPRVPFREVEKHLERSRTALRARGFELVGEPKLKRVAEGEVVRLPWSLDAKRCYVAVARSGDGLRDVDLFAFDSSGAEVARDLGAAANAQLDFCPEEAGVYTVELRAFEGSGAVGVMVIGRPRDIGVAERKDESIEKTEATPAQAVYARATRFMSLGFEPPVFLVRSGTIAPGEVRQHDLLAMPGCVVAIASAGGGETDVDLYLVDEHGGELSSDTGIAPYAEVAACRAHSSVLRLVAKAYGEQGQYAVGLLRAEGAPSSVRELRLRLVADPLLRRGFRKLEETVREFSEKERWSQALPREENLCVAVVAAGDAQVSDLDLFVRDAEGELVASETGPAPYGSVTTCADRSAPLRFEVISYRGAGAVSVAVFSRVAPADLN